MQQNGLDCCIVLFCGREFPLPITAASKVFSLCYSQDLGFVEEKEKGKKNFSQISLDLESNLLRDGVVALALVRRRKACAVSGHHFLHVRLVHDGQHEDAGKLTFPD